LTWCTDKNTAAGSDSEDSPIVLKITFSHEDIAEMIGTSRETVTRLLKNFRERGLITIKGADLVVRSCHTLEHSIGTHRRRAAM
ncbi:MAG TPA: helix-turn-helix domain-containing protein, partial [Pyrinomonadaceae bacterium]|nr:helix-turn-helix domain-containing protein [Pyrinomonadaceae bacterium]